MPPKIVYPELKDGMVPNPDVIYKDSKIRKRYRTSHALMAARVRVLLKMTKDIAKKKNIELNYVGAKPARVDVSGSVLDGFERAEAKTPRVAKFAAKEEIVTDAVSKVTTHYMGLDKLSNAVIHDISMSHRDFSVRKSRLVKYHLEGDTYVTEVVHKKNPPQYAIFLEKYYAWLEPQVFNQPGFEPLAQFLNNTPYFGGYNVPGMRLNPDSSVNIPAGANIYSGRGGIITGKIVPSGPLTATRNADGSFNSTLGEIILPHFPMNNGATIRLIHVFRQIYTRKVKGIPVGPDGLPVMVTKVDPKTKIATQVPQNVTFWEISPEFQRFFGDILDAHIDSRFIPVNEAGETFGSAPIRGIAMKDFMIITKYMRYGATNPGPAFIDEDKKITVAREGQRLIDAGNDLGGLRDLVMKPFTK